MNFVLFIILSLSFSCFGSEIMSESKDAFTYMGVSDGHKDLSRSLREAYSEAIREAVIHQFGQKYFSSEVLSSNESETKINTDIDSKTAKVSLIGIKPVKEEISENDNGTWLVKRWVSYSKSEILKERTRLKKSHEENILFNKVETSKTGMSGQLEVIVEPEGAKIVLTPKGNGNEVVATSPALFKISFGEYSLSVTSKFHHPHAEDIVIGGLKSRKRINLKRGTSNLSLNVKPSDATIYLNNFPQKVMKATLPVGQTSIIRVEHPDYESHEETLTPWFGQNPALNIQLKPKPAFISVISEPENSEIEIDGEYVGLTPLHDIAVKPGQREIKVFKKGFEQFSTYVEVKANSYHKPMTPMLKKAKPPQKYIKKEIDIIDDENDDHYVLALTYIPVISKGKKIGYEHLPFLLEIRPYKYFSAQAFFIMSQEENKSSSLLTDTSVYQGVGMRLFLLAFENFNLSVGENFSDSKKTVKQGNYRTVSRIRKNQFSHAVDMTIKFSQHTGIRASYHHTDNLDGSRGTYLLGLNFSF